VSYAIPADEPGGVAPAALSLLVHGVLFAVLVFGLRLAVAARAVVAELWSELPAIEPPEPSPRSSRSRTGAQDRAEDGEARHRDRTGKKESKEGRAAAQVRYHPAHPRAARAGAKGAAGPRAQDVLKQFASPPTAGLPDAGYIDKIRTKIKANIIPPSEIKGNPEVVFNIVQLPTGDVLQVRLVKTSGNELLDLAVDGLFGRAPAAEARSTRAMVARVQYQLQTPGMSSRTFALLIAAILLLAGQPGPSSPSRS